MFQFFFLCTLLFFLNGCVTSGEYLTLKNDVNRLKRDYYAHDRELSLMKKNYEAIKGTTQRSVGPEFITAIRESQEDIGEQLLSVSKELQVLQGRFDENKFFVEKSIKDSTLELDVIRSRIENVEDDLEGLKTTLSKIQTSLMRAAQPPVEKEEPKKTGLAEEARKLAAEDFYKNGQEYFKKKEYKKAREIFDEFLKQHPDHDLADNSQFWVGETYYREKDFENAIIEYEKLIKKFPKSPKVPSAMFKQAVSFESIGDKKAAEVVYQLIIQKYPDSSEAKKASKQLRAAPSKKR